VKPLGVLLIGFLLRVAIILVYPISWGGDTVIRLYDRYTLAKAHQLPLLQVLIAALSHVSMNPLFVQLMMAVIGAIAGLGFYRLAAEFCGEAWALPAALLFVSHPYILAVSTVPFQEILALAGLIFAFHFFYTDRFAAASLCLAIACLTRFEAWAACPALAVAYFFRKERGLTGGIKAVLLFGWMPAAWILSHHGLTTAGHYAVETFGSIWRLQRLIYVAWITTKFTQLPVLLLAAAGAWRMLRNRSSLDWRIWVQVGFLAAFLIGVLFSAHGVMPDPERYVTSREAHFAMFFILLLASVELPSWGRWSHPVVALTVVLGVGGAFWYVRNQVQLPEVQAAWQVARFLDQSVQPGQRVLFLTAPIEEEAARLYLDKVRKTGGEEGLRQARLELQEAARTPPDYQRTVVYSRLPREHMLATPSGCAEWIAVWSDYPDAARELAGEGPVKIIQTGPKSVAILRHPCMP
jgi:hypothetical protein